MSRTKGEKKKEKKEKEKRKKKKLTRTQSSTDILAHTACCLHRKRGSMGFIIRDTLTSVNMKGEVCSCRQPSHSHPTSRFLGSHNHRCTGSLVSLSGVFHSMPLSIGIRGPLHGNGGPTHSPNSHCRNRNIGHEGHGASCSLKSTTVAAIDSDNVGSQRNQLQPTKSTN